ncbi:MAG: DUF1926 domain-containing protein [candidate division Zixibacteria bacterium]|nr:DUF1926 domain-containing protein [candidate division Zixibacteria bacterium]
MAKFKLAFGIHNHQPVGNFDAVFDDAHRNAYAPFLKMVETFPSLSIALHQSGILWDWQLKNYPEYFEAVNRLLEKGRLELMTGGFYEPILTSIPERDARGQIKMLSEYIKKHFEVTPNGLWLTERIWEPHLPRVLAEAGVKYLPIDDTHFIYAGLEQRQLTGPFVTENEGRTVVLLPIQKRLRYLIPFGSVEEVIAELKNQAEDNPEGLAVYADDGEKFGVWPDTHKHCFEDGWLYKFFEEVEKNSDWLEIVPLGKAAEMKPAGRAYLPTASYAEMLHWALPTDASLEYENFINWLKEQGQETRYGRFVRGGHWRGFLTKYEESNLMHKKMLAVSDKLAAFEEKNPTKTDLAATAREKLYAGQCNCPYWHGVFGGLYLAHIRRAIYSHLIEADFELRNLNHDTGLKIKTRDYDADGSEEVIVTNDTYSAVFKPRRGGVLLDLSLNKYHFCLSDTMTRRIEGYHKKLSLAVKKSDEKKDKTASIHDQILTKEVGLAKYLIKDWYLKRGFIDHFFSDGVDFEAFSSGHYGEDGDFILEPFTYEIDSAKRQVTMTRDGHLWRYGGPVPVRLVKKFAFDVKSNKIDITYEISRPAPDRITVKFGVESNFNFQAGHAEDRFVLVDNRRPENYYLDAYNSHEQIQSIALVDQYLNLAVTLDSERPTAVWQMPIFTVSISESGFEKVYQGTTLVNVYEITLSQEPFVIKMTLSAGSLEEVFKNNPTLTAVNS